MIWSSVLGVEAWAWETTGELGHRAPTATAAAIASPAAREKRLRMVAAPKAQCGVGLERTCSSHVPRRLQRGTAPGAQTLRAGGLGRSTCAGAAGGSARRREQLAHEGGGVAGAHHRPADPHPV